MSIPSPGYGRTRRLLLNPLDLCCLAPYPRKRPFVAVLTRFSRLHFPFSHILLQIIPQSTKNRKKTRLGCFLTKLFLPFDKNIIYQPKDENIVLASKIFCPHSQMTKRQDSKKIHHTLPNAENAEIHLLKKYLKWEIIRSD